MTDKQINTAIAEACGWTDIRDSGIWHNFAPWGLPPQVKSPKETSSDYISVPNFVPNYCNDLNAMAQAEKTLTNVSDAMEYSYLLEDMENMIEDWVPYRTLWSLSPRQRAEAFLRTLGLWKTDQSGERTEMEVQE